MSYQKIENGESRESSDSEKTSPSSQSGLHELALCTAGIEIY